MFVEVINQVFNGEVPSIINNYLELQTYLDVSQSKLLKSLFSKMELCEIRSTNSIVNGLIIDSLVMVPKQKKSLNILDDNTLNYLIEINVGDINNNIGDIRKAYYLKTLTTLIQKINYISEEEQFLFNSLFEEMLFGNKKLKEIDHEGKRFVIK